MAICHDGYASECRLLDYNSHNPIASRASGQGWWELYNPTTSGDPSLRKSEIQQGSYAN